PSSTDDSGLGGQRTVSIRANHAIEGSFIDDEVRSRMVSKRHWQISRRTVLRGVGAAVALPWLEAMAPRAKGSTSPAAPTRLACLYMPNGVLPAAWNPSEAGKDYKLPTILEPLAPVRDDVTVIT